MIDKPLWALWVTDHGIDGWDAKTWQVAFFSSEELAIAYLKRRGFTHHEWDAWYHEDINKRNTMGAISYKIVAPTIPIDPE